MLPQCATNRLTAGGSVPKVLSSISVMTEITALTVGAVKQYADRRVVYVKRTLVPGDVIGRLAEQHFFRLFAPGRTGVEGSTFFIGAHRGGARLDRLEPSLEMRKILQPLPLQLIRNYPWIARHVGDGIGARDELPVSQPLVQHAVETVGLVDVTIDGIGNLFRSVAREMMVLSRHRA